MEPSDAIEMSTLPELEEMMRTRQMELERIENLLKNSGSVTDRDRERIKAMREIKAEAKRELEKGNDPAGNCVVIRKTRKALDPCIPQSLTIRNRREDSRLVPGDV
jgi:hypothetical protein